MKLDWKRVNWSWKEWVGIYANCSHVADLPGGSGRGGGGGGWTLGFKEIYKYDSTTILTNAVGMKIHSGPGVTEMMTTSRVLKSSLLCLTDAQL